MNRCSVVNGFHFVYLGFKRRTYLEVHHVKLHRFAPSRAMELRNLGSARKTENRGPGPSRGGSPAVECGLSTAFAT
jgi:hypothetical protein